jgi:H+/Cl- antiporter ClcA
MSITGLPVHHRALIWYGSDHIFCVFSAYYTRLQGFGDPADSLILELVYHYSTMTLQHSMPQIVVGVQTGCLSGFYLFNAFTDIILNRQC